MNRGETVWQWESAIGSILAPIELKERPEKVMGFLLWADIIQRVDVVIEEIRHFQVNLIHNLRVPSLYRPLRFEEHYLNGTFVRTFEKPSDQVPQSFSWAEALKTIRAPNAGLRDLARAWVVDFPNHASSRSEDGKSGKSIEFRAAEGFVDKDVHSKIADDLQQEIEDRIWAHGLWRPESRRTYERLCAAQMLKRNILLDKLHVSWWGGRCFGWVATGLTGETEAANAVQGDALIAHLIFLRAAVVRRLHEAIARLDDLQSQFEKLLDLDFPDHHRPLTGRRHEQGLYSSFLAFRCQLMMEGMHDLLDALFDDKWEAATRNDPVLHRWEHHFSSRATAAVDWTWPHPQPAGRTSPGTKKRPAVRFINSSYWMPDRPELLAALGHEVAEHIIRQRMDDLDTSFLNRSKDPLSALLRDIQYWISVVIGRENVSPPQGLLSWHESILREFASDFLALSLLGPSYVYALALETFGVGLEDIFRDDADQVDINLGSFIWEEGLGRFTPIPDWYYRLRGLVAVLDEVFVKHGKPGTEEARLAHILALSLRALLDRLLDYFAARAFPNNKTAQQWRTVGDRLEMLVRESRFVRTLRSQLKQRDQRAERSGSYRPARAVMPLPLHLQRDLIDDYIARKSSTGAKGRLLRRFLDEFDQRQDRPKEKTGDHKSDPRDRADQSHDNEAQQSHPPLKDLFRCLYLDHPDPLLRRRLALRDWREEPTSSSDDLLIFRHFRDIPWQCSIMRALDLLAWQPHRITKNDPTADSITEDGFYQLNHDFSPGGEIYLLALELVTWQNKHAIERLKDSVRTVREIIEYKVPIRVRPEQEQEGQKFIERLNWWLWQDKWSDFKSEREEADSLDDAEERIAKKRKKEIDAKRERVTAKIAGLADQIRRGSTDSTKLEERINEICEISSATGLLTYSSVFVEGGLFDKSRRYREYFVSVVAWVMVKKLQDLLYILREIITHARQSTKRDRRADEMYNGLRILHDYLLYTWSPDNVDAASDWFSHHQRHVYDDMATVIWAGLKRSQPKSQATTSTRQLKQSSTKTGISTPLRYYTLSRMSLCNKLREPELKKVNYEIRKEKDDISFATIGWGMRSCAFDIAPPGSNEAEQTDKQDIYFTTLGRFDVLYIRRYTPLQKWPLPSLEAGYGPLTDTTTGTSAPVDHARRKKPNKEKFVPYFERRDLFIPIWLGEGDAQGNRADSTARIPFATDSNTVALVAVSLGQRGYRLEFLRQLLPKDIVSNTEGRQSKQQANISEDGFFGPDDWAFLAEGSGDIMIAFGKRQNAKSEGKGLNRLDQVLDFQKRVYDDFCVERTEMLLTRECLPFALMKPRQSKTESNFRLCVRIRMAEDRHVQNFVVEFEEALKMRLERHTKTIKYFYWSKLRYKNELGRMKRRQLFLLNSVPGRVDIEIWFDTVFLRDLVQAEWEAMLRQKKREAPHTKEKEGSGAGDLNAKPDGRFIMSVIEEIIYHPYCIEVSTVVGRRMPLS